MEEKLGGGEGRGEVVVVGGLIAKTDAEARDRSSYWDMPRRAVG